MDETAENKSSERPKSAVRKPRLLRVASLKPPEMPEKLDNGTTVYRMIYVSMEGKQLSHPCTKQVYQRIESQRLTFRKKSDFVLSFNPESGIIENITEQPRPDSMPGFKKETEPNRDEGKALILTCWPDGALSYKHVPERVTEGTLQEVMDAVRDFEEDISPGTKVGNYMVLERREVVGATELTIDPMAR